MGSCSAGMSVPRDLRFFLYRLLGSGMGRTGTGILGLRSDAVVDARRKGLISWASADDRSLGEEEISSRWLNSVSSRSLRLPMAGTTEVIGIAA